jgi:hypothetical protein
MLCQYKDALGVPGVGVHKHWLGIAWSDVIMTVVGSAAVAFFFRISFFPLLAGMFLLGIVLHRVFCVRTTVDRALFSDP